MAYLLRFGKGNLAMQAVVLSIALFSCLPVFNAQNYKVVYKEIPDNRGTEFVVGFMQQFNQELDGATRLFITSDYNTRAVITASHTNVRKEIVIKSRELYPIDMPTSIRMEGTKIETKGIHIKADAEIVVYGLNIKKFTTDAYLALPVDIQSTKYIVPSFKPSYRSLIGIIAIYDRTIIFVTFKFSDRKSTFKYRGRSYRHRDTLSITLQRLQTFQIGHSKDLTGTRIFSTKPISVLSGNECANVPKEKGYCDHLVEHIPPVNTWGKRFITAPLAGRHGGDFFRILASNSSTDVRINGKFVKSLDEGMFIEVDVASSRYQYIETSKPSLVVQFSKGQKVDETFTDPFMVMIPPVEQYTAQYTISTPDQNEQYFESYINIVIDTKEIDGLRLDGKSLRDEKWLPIWGTTHSAARISVSHGVHRVMHDSPIVPFAIFLYGYARADSYGYPGGLRLADLTLQCVPGHPGDGLDNDCDRRIDEEIANYIDDDNDGRIDEDLVTDPPEIVLDIDTVILNGCPASLKKKLKEPIVKVAPLCTSRGPIKLSYVDTVNERDCVQYVDRLWLVRDGCGNLANVTQQIRIKRPEMRVTFPDDVRGKCHLGEDMSEVGEPQVKMSCREDRFSVRYGDTPALVECIRRGRSIGREWTVKASCGSAIKHVQKLLPDVTPPKINFVGELQYLVKSDFRISWNASEESTFECSLDGPNNPRPCGRGWSETWSKRDIPDGKKVFWVRATDLAGNTGAFITHPFQVDSSGPRLDFVRPLKALSRGPMAIVWQSNEMARFKCGLNPDRMEQCGSGTRGKDYRRDLQDGTYTFYVGAVDKIGNEAKIIHHTFKIDSMAPRIKFGKALQLTLNSKVDLPILSNEPAEIFCSLDGEQYNLCGNGTSARFAADDLSEGPHELRVKATDRAGNEADPISLKWNSDKTSPNIIFTPGLPTKFRARPRITWNSTEYARFECSLDNNLEFGSCGRGSEGEWSGLMVNPGVHDFYVRGTDRHGNVGPLSSFRFTIDNKHPRVYLKRPLPTTSTSQTETFRWASDEMAYYKCAVDDTSSFKDCGSGTTGDWTTPSLSNDKHTFYLTAKDEVGNTAPTLKHTWTIDNIAPVLTFTGELPDNVNKNKQKFSWTSSEFAKFYCYIDSETQPFSCGSGKTGSWRSAELLDGPHTFKVFGRDEHKNQGPVSQHTWDIDTKAPTVNLAKVPETLNKSKVNFNWKSDEPAKFLCALDKDTEGEECGEGIDGEYLTPTLADGEHEFRLLVEDMVGNMAPLIRSKFSIDTSLPVITFDKTDPDTPQKDLRVTWKSSEIAVFECALDAPTKYEDCGNGKTGVYQKDDLNDGEHKLYVRGRDEIGNVGLPSVYTVTIDQTPPTAIFTDKSRPISKKSTETFTWEADEIVTFKCRIDERQETDCGRGFTGEFTTPDLPDGEHVFQVTPVDLAGNEGKTLEGQWKKDSDAPVLQFTSQPPLESKDSVTFKWESTENAEFECALDNKEQPFDCDKGFFGSKSLNNIPKGSRVFWVRGTDDAGNVGEFVSHHWSVDTNPPDIEFTGDLPSFSKKSLRFTWKSNEHSNFECALNNTAVILAWTFEACSSGVRGNKSLENLQEGRHTFYVRARDELDNVGRPISHSWIVDSTAPRASLDPVSPTVRTPRITLSWKADERSKFFCAIGDVGNVIECGQGTTGSWTTPYLRRGPQKFWLIAEDYTGNRAEPVSVEWTVDNIAPVVTFSSDSTSTSTTGNPRFSWTSDEPADFDCAIQGVTGFEKCGNGTSGSWTGRNVPDGKRTFLVHAQDPYGNQNDPYTFPFEVDTTLPTGFVTTRPPRRTNKPRATFGWRSNEDANYKCILDNQNPTDCGEGTAGQYLTNSLPDGVHNFAVVATDDLGNSAPIVNSTWTIDTVGPTLSFPRDLPKHTVSRPRFKWTSDEHAERFLCSLDGQSNWEFCGSGKSGGWQRYNVPDGNYQFFVQGIDDLGNKGPEISHFFKVDFTPPELTITKSPNPSSSSPTVEWRSTEPVDFKCIFDDGQSFDCGNGTTGSWTGSNVPDGSQRFVIEGKDKVGNTGRFTVTWTKDSTVPTITFDDDQPKITSRTPRFTWTSSEFANFECSLDGFRTIEQCGSGWLGSWQRYKPDGQYELSVRGRDSNRNIGIPAKHSFRVDSTPPELTITESPDLSSSSPTIKWHSTEPVDFECTFDDGQSFDCGNGTTGSWTGSNIPDGSRRFVIEGKDKVGNTGRFTVTWTKDSTVPSITFDDNQPNVTLRTPRFTWTSSEFANFECSLDGFRTIERCGSGWLGSWQRYKPDGQYELSVRGRDSNGNIGIPAKHSFRVDDTAPTIKLTTTKDLKTSSPTIEWSSSEDVKFECVLDGGQPFECGDGKTGSWIGSNLPDGEHSFVIEGKDEAKNTGQHTFTWNKDSAGPQVTFQPDQPTVTLPFPRFSWTSTETARFQCSFDDFVRDIQECGYGTTGSWQRYKPDGSYTLSVRGSDANGNTGSPVSHSFRVDNKAPIISIRSPPALNSSTPTIEWSTNEYVTFQCSLDNQFFDCGEGNSSSWTGNNLDDGLHRFTIQGKDEVGNIGKHTHTWSQDTEAPQIQFRQRPDPADTSPRFAWSSTEPAIFHCSLDGVKYEECGRGYYGQWQKTGVSKGPHTFSVRGTDASGNTGLSNKHTWTVDASGPDITLENPVLIQNRALFSWKSDKPAQFFCSMDNQNSWRYCGSGISGRIPYYNLEDGNHTFYVRGRDNRRNMGSPASQEFYIDNKPPIVTVTNSTTGSTRTPSFTFVSNENAKFKCAIDDTRLYEPCGEGLTGKYTARNVPDGRHAFFVQGTDKYNVGPHVRFLFTIDTTGPRGYLTSNIPQVTRNPRVHLTWISYEDDVTFKCTVDGKAFDCGTGRDGEFTTDPLPDGEHVFTVDLVDKVGNEGEPIIVRWETDSSSPVIHFDPSLPQVTSRNPKISWNSSEYAYYDCILDGVQSPCDQGTSGDMTFSVSKGPHTFSVRGTDNYGNVGEWKRHSFNVDGDGPVITFPKDLPTVTKSNPSFTWSSSESASFTCAIDNNFNRVDCGQGPNGQWTGNNIPDGQYVFIVSGRDKFGNQGPQTRHRFTVDNTVPVITFQTRSERTNGKPEIRWSSSENAFFECSLDGAEYQECGNGFDGLWTGNNLPDGKHHFSVRGIDRNNNTGEPKRFEWHVDTKPPALSITSDNPSKTNNPRQKITWDSDEQAKFECTLDGQIVDCGTGTNGQYTTRYLPDGKHTFSVNGVDDLGNKGTPKVVKWTTDKRGPGLNITSDNPPKTNKITQSITWTSSEQADFKCKLNGRVVYCGSGTDGFYTTPNLPDGNFTFEVTAVDKLGNTGPTKVVSWSKDTRGPRVEITNSIPPETNNANMRITWSSDERAKFVCLLDDVETACGDGSTGDYTTLDLIDGKHSFTVSSVDPLGNEGRPVTVEWNIDSTAPDITFSSTLPDKIRASPLVTWTSSEYSKFECALDNQSRSIRCGDGTSGGWNGLNIPHGPHTFWVRGTDGHDNVGKWKPYEFEVDIRPPKVEIEPPFPKKTSSKSINIRWSSDEQATYFCIVDDLPAINCGSDSDRKWTTPILDDGEHTFSLTAVDRVGNRAPTLRKKWTVDTSGPNITFAANQPTRTTNSPTFRWTSSEPANFKCALDNDGQLNFIDCGSGTGGQWTGENIPDGSFRLLVYGVDETNNRGPIAEHTFVTDSSPPQITFSGDLPESTSRNPALTWSSNEFAKFECKLEDGVIFECGEGDDGLWTGRNLNDGPHSLSVRGTDNLGNKGQFISRSFNVDESGPRLNFVGDYPSRARRLPRIRWVSNEFAFFECSVNGREFTRCGQGMEGSWGKQEVSTGSQKFTVRGRDTKGNLGEPITITIEIDTTSPKLTLLEPLPNKTEQPTWTFTWTSTEIANFTCAVGSLANKKDCGFGLNGRFTTDPLADGRHKFYLLGKDELGNSARFVRHTWTVDKIKPEIEFLPNQPTISDAEITLHWKTTSSKPAEKFECALDDVRSMRSCGKGLTGSWTDTNIPDGDHTLYVRAKDSFGDYGEIKTHKWKVDTKVPQVELIGTPPARSTYDIGAFYWESDEYAKYECAVDLAESGTPCGSGRSMNWNSPRLDDGEHTFYLFATDTNGNQARTKEYIWKIDTKPPIVTLDENTERVSGHNVTIKWRANENAHFQCAVDSIFNNIECGFGQDSQIKLSNLDDGPHTIWIKAVDELGNIAPWKKHTWNVDSKPPELDFTSKLPTKTSGDVSFFWKSKEPATKFKCGTDPSNMKDCGVGDSGNWSAKNLSDGEHEFYVEATDKFRNTIRIMHRWTVDNIPPLLSWRKKPPAVSGKRIQLNWTSSEIADFFCAHESTEHMERCGNLSLIGTWITDNLPEGKHRFWVFGVDDVGNHGRPLEHEWVVDTKGPTLFFNQPVPKKSGRSVRFSWRSNEHANFKCTMGNPNGFVDCGQGFESFISSDNLRRNGEHVLYVKGIDDYGNVGETIYARWIVDLVAPVLIDVGPLPRLMNRNPVITWTVNEEAVFECALDDLNKYAFCGNGTKGKFEGENLPNGPHQIVVRVKDRQGNTKTLIDHKFVVGIPDNRGREFMLAFMQQYLHKKAGSISLFITSDNHTVATVYIPGVNNFRQEIHLQPDELVRVDLPINARLSGTQKEKKGILVTAENELVVYGLNIMPHSTDAFLALPTDIQGTEYYAVSYTVSQHSLIAIVGIYDNTVIYITLRMSKDVPLIYQGSAYRDGETMIIPIDRQQTFQLTHTEDLTGTRIASTQVVSVYSGNECANVPQQHGYCDHLVEMLTPTSTWGRRFVTAPLFSRKSGDFFRIVASQDNTLVTFHPNDGQRLQAGDFMERDVPSDEYKFITATKPCMLMQYSKGADSDDTDTDPFLIMIPPIEQYGSHYILSTPDRHHQQYFQSYINIIVLSEHYQGVLVDGNPAYMINQFKRIPGTPYSASAVRVTKGVHRVDHSSPIVTFGAFMYGYAWRDSYGYPGGLRLADITGECTGVDTPADGMDNDCDRRIDEELKNGIDDDGDGRIDEDLATFPPTIELDDPYYEYESCVFEVDALVPRPKAISSAECNYKGALRLTFRDTVFEKECTSLINRTWQASDGCGNVVYLNQVIKIIRPTLLVHFPVHVPNGCVGAIGLRTTGRPEIESPCKQERVRIAYRDNISKKDCQEKGLLLERHFTVTEVCGREYTGVQRIYPGARS